MKKIRGVSKKRLVLVLVLACSLFFGLITRTGYLQLIKGDWLSSKASEQQTREIPIEPKRGTIYDSNMKELAVSVTKYTVWCKPVEVEDKEDVASKLAEVLGKEEKDIYKLVNKKMSLISSSLKISLLKISLVWRAKYEQKKV